MVKPQVVFVSGNFNILHPGHLRLLRFARELGDRLIVGVNSDRVGGVAVHVPQAMRLEGVSCNNWVSEAFLVDEPIEQVLSRLRPDIVVKGKEFESELNPETEILNQYGGKLVFSSGEVAFSSLDLIRKSLSDTAAAPLQFPRSFAQRHDVQFDALGSIVERFSGVKVCVVGDLIIDEYITCDPLGMSQEDPTIVVTPIDTRRFVGGAGIVAAHAAGMGASVSLVTVTGNDPTRTYAAEALSGFGVDARLLLDESRPTTLKQRYRAQSKTLLRVSHLHQGSVGRLLQEKLVEQVVACLERCDLLVFSDFNYGCLPQPVVDRIITYGRQRKLIMIADSQCSSQVGDVSRFQHMDLLSATEREARISLRNQEDGLVIMAERLRTVASAQNVMLKLGAEGVLLQMQDTDKAPRTDRLPALNTAPVDVAGAGDSMLIAAGLALAAKASPWQAAALGTVAAALQVGRLGNQPLGRTELITTLRSRVVSL
ncbi:MAG TPA: PfkB family carbohydrate kinase [Dongiaceae bacterium]|nr:PfkB family carbohydrate kinase [Dongiaceae bacterium]